MRALGVSKMNTLTRVMAQIMLIDSQIGCVFA